MLETFQDFKDGDTKLLDIPMPLAKGGHWIIRTKRAGVSAGRERILVNFGKESALEKAWQLFCDSLKIIIKVAAVIGRQSAVVVIDIRKNVFGKYLA